MNIDRYHINVILFIRFVPYRNNNEMTMRRRKMQAKMDHTYGFRIKWMLYGNFSFSFWIPSMCERIDSILCPFGSERKRTKEILVLFIVSGLNEVWIFFYTYLIRLKVHVFTCHFKIYQYNLMLPDFKKKTRILQWKTTWNRIIYLKR